ncbi:rifin PIR protein, putative [Plasmodium reichenowi]|uniref:Rifin PIR protein, putative n=1 Tax=Plasmodium reichenowi TaxID=5854 RepID=A0A2P9DSJ9_PLARE|nr:rifin PIR protein, putative [Plasmodium reichenowi]
MKVYYINILLFALPLNILVHNKWNHKSITPRHTPITRLLCECELYAPANYDNDPEMNEVMQQFEDRTSERLRDYDDRMKSKRMQCKDKCDKEIQKIILKDKLEKELMDKFATLQTDIQSDSIPTCVCEKSVEAKVEKGCLRCAQNMGGIVAPSSGVLGEIAALSVNAWKTTAIDVATKYAMAQGVAKGAIAGKDAGMKVVIRILQERGIEQYCNGIYKSMLKIDSFADLKTFVNPIIAEHDKICMVTASSDNPICRAFDIKLGVFTADGKPGPPANQLVPGMLDFIAKKAELTATDQAAKVSSATYSKIMTKQTALVEGGFNSTITSIYAAIIAIVVIILIMVIIYKILRYRRKKKMKKKLQYIKLLEE